MNYIKSFLYSVVVFIDEFATYFVTGVALTLGYYAGVDAHNWLVSFK